MGMIKIGTALFDFNFRWAAVPDVNDAGKYIVCMQNREKIVIRTTYEEIRDALIDAGYMFVN